MGSTKMGRAAGASATGAAAGAGGGVAVTCGLVLAPHAANPKQSPAANVRRIMLGAPQDSQGSTGMHDLGGRVVQSACPVEVKRRTAPRLGTGHLVKLGR